MIKPTIITWIIAVFGAITFLPLMFAQLIMLIRPNDQKTKDLLIGKGEDWRDRTHFKSALAFAWADWLLIFPLLVAGITGVLLGHLWGYVAWLAYFTYYWGIFLYWGIAAVVYSVIKIV
jgi:hypothetical protein